MLQRLAGRVVTGRVAFFVSGLIDVSILLAYLARRSRRRRAGLGGLAVVALGGAVGLGLAGAWGGWAGSASARADTTEQSILMDDGAFIYSSPAAVERHLEQVAGLGVTTVKVSMVWALVAPDADSRTKPDFDAGDPDAYPTDAWTRYDTLVSEAGALGLKVYFQLTAPAPLWATDPKITGHQHPWSHEVNARDFTAFAVAVGARYSGSWAVAGDGDTYGPEAGGVATTGPPGTTTTGTTTGTTTDAAATGTTTTATATTTTGTTTLPGPAGTGVNSGDTAASSTAIPAVHMWGIWNEPNEVGWLSPQTVRVGHSMVAEAPILERALINGGYEALLVTGHARDTILIGETASGGNTHVIPFIQALFCVGADNRPLTGAAARLEDCPVSGDRRTFVVENPGLFGASGWAHHPYSFDHDPATPFAHKPWLITLANVSSLEHELDAVDAAYGEPTGLPVYMTEWGFKSDPPNPYVHTTLLQQETWLDEGWYLSYLQPRVKSLAQELLYDQPPVAGQRPGSLAYWNTIDSGLEFQDGADKPAYAAFRLPIWLPVQRPGRAVRLWAEIRPAQEAHNPVAVLEYRARETGAWTELTQLRSTSPEGFIYTHVDIPHAGEIRLAWGDPVTGTIDDSRIVTIS